MSFDDIWFTSRARISAEIRLKNNDFHSQMLLIWYAIASAASGIIAIRYPIFAGRDTDIYIAILSVALLTMSLLVATRDYRGRAMKMRTNHIALKFLYDSLQNGVIDQKEKPRLYSDLLGDCENHSTYDDRYFRVFNRKGLKTRIPKWDDFLLMWLMLITRLAATLVLYAIPIILLLIAY